MSITFQPAVVITGTDVVDAEAPQIAVSGQNVYVLFHEPPTASSGIIHDVYFAASANRGGSFAPRINLSDSAAVTSEGEDMALSGGRIYVVWSENFDSIRFRRSTNQGAGFDTALPLSTAAGAQHPQIKADGDEVYVVWEANGPAGTDIFFAHSDDRGRNFDPEQNLSNSGQALSPQIALAGGRVLVTWRDSSNAAKGFEIVVAQGR